MGYVVLGVVVLKGYVSVDESNDIIAELSSATHNQLTTLPFSSGMGVLVNAINEDYDFDLFVSELEKVLNRIKDKVSKVDVSLWRLDKADKVIKFGD